LTYKEKQGFQSIKNQATHLSKSEVNVQKQKIDAKISQNMTNETKKFTSQSSLPLHLNYTLSQCGTNTRSNSQTSTYDIGQV